MAQTQDGKWTLGQACDMGEWAQYCYDNPAEFAVGDRVWCGYSDKITEHVVVELWPIRPESGLRIVIVEPPVEGADNMQLYDSVFLLAPKPEDL